MRESMAQRVRSLTERTWTIATNVCCQYVFVLKRFLNSSSFYMSSCVYLEKYGTVKEVVICPKGTSREGKVYVQYETKEEVA